MSSPYISDNFEKDKHKLLHTSNTRIDKSDMSHSKNIFHSIRYRMIRNYKKCRNHWNSQYNSPCKQCSCWVCRNSRRIYRYCNKDWHTDSRSWNTKIIRYWNLFDIINIYSSMGLDKLSSHRYFVMGFHSKCYYRE